MITTISLGIHENLEKIRNSCALIAENNFFEIVSSIMKICKYPKMMKSKLSQPGIINIYKNF